MNPGLANVLTPLDLTTDTFAKKSIDGQLTSDSTGGTAAVLYGHDTTNGPGDSGSIATNTTTSKVAQVAVPTAVTDASYPIYLSVYGPSKLNASGAPNDGTYLVAFGFGPSSELNGRTALGAPSLFVRDPLDYNRPVLLLKVYPTGTTNPAGAGAAAGTAGALSPDGLPISGNISKYNAAKRVLFANTCLVKRHVRFTYFKSRVLPNSERPRAPGRAVKLSTCHFLFT